MRLRCSMRCSRPSPRSVRPPMAVGFGRRGPAARRPPDPGVVVGHHHRRRPHHGARRRRDAGGRAVRAAADDRRAAGAHVGRPTERDRGAIGALGPGLPAREPSPRDRGRGSGRESDPDWTDGTPRERIPPDIATADVQPAWAPDGKRILARISRSTPSSSGRSTRPVSRRARSCCRASRRAVRGTKRRTRPTARRSSSSRPEDRRSAASRPIADYLYDRVTQTSEPIHRFACGIEEDRQPRISPDGSSVAFWRSRHAVQGPSQAVDDAAIFVRDLATGEERQVTDWSVHATSLDWSPDGR